MWQESSSDFKFKHSDKFGFNHMLLAKHVANVTGKNEQNNHLYANTDTIKIPDKYAHHKYAYPTGATHTHEYADMRL